MTPVLLCYRFVRFTMGIATGTFQQLLQEHRLRPLGSPLLTLGKQDIFLTSADVDYWTNYYGIPCGPTAGVEYSSKPEYAKKGYLSDRELFRRLGVASESMDASDYEGCDYVGDLNSPNPPANLRGKYDLVLDAGTFEHVFHLPNAFQFCHALLRDGGRMIHMSPLSNYPDHGFYMMSPTLFYDFYETNGWRILQMKVIRHTKAHDTEPYWSTDYSPDHFAHLSFGGLGDGLYQTFAVVEKLPGATADRIPQQRVYRVHAWRGSSTAADQGGGEVTEQDIARRVRDRLSQYRNWIKALGTAGNSRIAIFGAGGHTVVLLRTWREMELPEPDVIVQSAKPTAVTFDGVPVIAFDDLQKQTPPALLVLSSQLHEGEMAAICGKAYPAVPTLRFWS